MAVGKLSEGQFGHQHDYEYKGTAIDRKGVYDEVKCKGDGCGHVTKQRPYESMPAMVSIRPGVYRGDSGHMLSGKDTQGRKVKVFAPGERAAAEKARDNIKSGRPAFGK